MKERKKLSLIKEKAEVGLRNVPEGTLRLGKSHGCVQYYHCLPGGHHNGKYISKSESELPQRLAQKTYDEQVFRLADRRLSQIDTILKNYENDEIEHCFLVEHPERQKLITPVEPLFQQKLQKWIETPYDPMPIKDDMPTTIRGMHVRSKSEKILADYFDSRNIPYKYECPLYLQTYGTVYPDFTFLDSRTGQEIYWEHEGMMDDQNYARSAVKKIESYEKNGIFPGERLILTFETSTSILSTELIRKLTEKYLL